MNTDKAQLTNNHTQEHDMKTYAIVETRYYYGPRDKSSLIMADGMLAVREFKTRTAAQAWIDNQPVPHQCAHNECDAPDYNILTVGSVRFRRAYRQTFGGGEWS